MNIYVANISFKVTESHLRELFEEFGEVSTVKIITDKFTGRSKGFGFIEMPNESEAKIAINDLNGVALNGKNLVVNIAKPMSPKPRTGTEYRSEGGFEKRSFNR